MSWSAIAGAIGGGVKSGLLNEAGHTDKSRQSAQFVREDNLADMEEDLALRRESERLEQEEKDRRLKEGLESSLEDADDFFKGDDLTLGAIPTAVGNLLKSIVEDENKRAAIERMGAPKIPNYMGGARL
tara:strand:- start:7392 stop:7778 length:387 start_codon:yes stop_codon:yes gene_type:complete